MSLGVVGLTAATHAQGVSAVSVSLAQWSVTPSVASTTAGDVTFTVTNNGDFPHEFVVFQTDLPANALPLSGSAVDEGQVSKVGKLEALGGGESGSLTLNLSAGNYVLICNVPGHYGQGMRAVFTVAAAAAPAPTGTTTPTPAATGTGAPAIFSRSVTPSSSSSTT